MTPPLRGGGARGLPDPRGFAGIGLVTGFGGSAQWDVPRLMKMGKVQAAQGWFLFWFLFWLGFFPQGQQVLRGKDDFN